MIFHPNINSMYHVACTTARKMNNVYFFLYSTPKLALSSKLCQEHTTKATFVEAKRSSEQKCVYLFFTVQDPNSNRVVYLKCFSHLTLVPERQVGKYYKVN